MKSFVTTNPASGDNLKTYSYKTPSEIEKILTSAQKSFLEWRRTSFADRSIKIQKLAEALRKKSADLSQIIHLEMGKSLAEAKAEIEKCAATCEYFAAEAEGMLRSQIIASPYRESYVSFQPLGVVFCIMPWNFPIWQTIRFAAPALMAGNVVVMKHSDITAGTAEMLGEIFQEISPELNIFQNCHVDHDGAAEVMAHKNIRGVTFTGSSRGGREVAQVAAVHLKKTVLELGGSDAYLIFSDADLTFAAKTAAKARLQNCGQSCIAAKRFIVCQDVAKEFIQKFTEEMKKVEIAPLAHKKFQKQIIEQVEKLKSLGGRVVLGGTAPEGPGAFYSPTIIVFDENHKDIHDEEIFGPVATVIVVKDEKEAVEVANSSSYGLGGGIFTRDQKKGKELLEKELEAGFVVLNDFVRSDARLPFGGVKDSGYGRELGHFGIQEFVNIKTVALGNKE